MNKITINEYSKIFLKSLTDKSFSNEYLKNSNERARNFLPLYSAINDVLPKKCESIFLRKVANYKDMLDGTMKHDWMIQKFIKSHNGYSKRIEMKENVDKLLTNSLWKIVADKNISSYKIINTYKVNPKIATQIKNMKKISLSVTSKNELLKRLNK